MIAFLKRYHQLSPGLLHLSAIPTHFRFVLRQLRDFPAGCEWLQQLWVSHPHDTPSRTRGTLPAFSLKDEKVPLSWRPMLHCISLILVGLCAHLRTNPMASEIGWPADFHQSQPSLGIRVGLEHKLSGKRETRIDDGETKNSCLLQQLQGTLKLPKT